MAQERPRAATASSAAMLKRLDGINLAERFPHFARWDLLAHLNFGDAHLNFGDAANVHLSTPLRSIRLDELAQHPWATHIITKLK